MTVRRVLIRVTWRAPPVVPAAAAAAAAPLTASRSMSVAWDAVSRMSERPDMDSLLDRPPFPSPSPSPPAAAAAAAGGDAARSEMSLSNVG